MEKAGASKKTDVKIIAHITNTAPMPYLMITTMVRTMTHMVTNPIKKVINMYTDYWKANVHDAYEAVKETARADEALVILAAMTDSLRVNSVEEV
jgi:hypothetical protein